MYNLNACQDMVTEILSSKFYGAACGPSDIQSARVVTLICLTYHTGSSMDISAPAHSVGNWQAILTLVLFFLSSASLPFLQIFILATNRIPVTDLAVIFPLRVPLPLVLLKTAHHALAVFHIIPHKHAPPKPRHVPLNLVTVPLFSVLVLLATGAFDGHTLRDVIVGTGGIQPLNIMALFLSLVRGPLRS